jgi:hypothetical protein
MALSLPGRLLSEVAPLLAVMRTVNQQLAYSDGVIEAITRPDARVQRLRTVPSVGPVTAAAFVATIDDAGRFHRAHEVEAYLGLVPRELSSGESHRRGRITKAGNTRMRWLLVQAAVSILRCRHRQTEALRGWATRIAARRGKKIAVVALARRLAGILYAMLRDGTRYAFSTPSQGGLVDEASSGRLCADGARPAGAVSRATPGRARGGAAPRRRRATKREGSRDAAGTKRGSSGFSVGSPYILGVPPVHQTPVVPVIGWVASGGRYPRPLAWVAAPEAAGATPTTASATRLSGPGTRGGFLPTSGGHPRRTRMNLP